jgi:hypothetical protein
MGHHAGKEQGRSLPGSLFHPQFSRQPTEFSVKTGVEPQNLAEIEKR